MDWRVGTPPVNRHIALRLDDLNDINRDLLAVAKDLIDMAEAGADDQMTRRLGDEAMKLSDLSRRLSLATRSIAHATVAIMEAS